MASGMENHGSWGSSGRESLRLRWRDLEGEVGGRVWSLLSLSGWVIMGTGGISSRSIVSGKEGNRTQKVDRSSLSASNYCEMDY